MPGGGPRIPIGGGPRIPIGGAPGGGIPGMPRPCGCIICGGGAPTPRAGPLSPGAGPDCAGTPRPAARPRPGPPDTPGIGTLAMPSCNQQMKQSDLIIK